MKQLACLLLILFVIGCGKSTKETSGEVQDTISQNPKINEKAVATETKLWYVDLVENYIANSKKELIICERKAGTSDWELDNQEVCDTANYYIFKIGHTETDEGNTNPRFTASGWIYIDSLTQKIYEYDLPNDQLVLWKNK